MHNCDTLSLIEKDEFYQQFLENASNREGDSYITQGLTVAEQLKKLAEGIGILEKELHQQVLSNLEELLSQATLVEKLENVLTTMLPHVQGVLSSVERLRAQVLGPFELLERQTQVLSRLHATSDTLRHAARTQHLVRRLETQVLAGEINKAAHSLNEIAQLAEDADLSGLELLEADQKLIQTYRADVERKAHSILLQGLASSNSTQVSTAVQVFHNLGNLPSVITKLVSASEDRVTVAIQQALDVQMLTNTNSSGSSRNRGGPGRAAVPSLGNNPAFRTRLWASLEQLFEGPILTECCKIELLQRVMSRRSRDALPTSMFLEVLPTEHQPLVSNFWQKIIQILGKQLIESSKGSSFLKQALEGEYPKFLRLYLDLCKKLQANQSSMEHSENGIVLRENVSSISTHVFSVNRQIVVPFENAYLSQSLSRLLDPVNIMFSGDTVPSHEEVDSLVRTITSELSVSLVDETLSNTIARNISKTVRLFCLKCEQMLVTSGEATQVIGPCTPGQLLNIQLANLLYYLSGQVTRVLANMQISLPLESANIVNDALGHIKSLTQTAVAPLLSSIVDAVEAIVLTMHNEDYSVAALPSSRKNDVSCSLYMKELQSFISRAVTTYLAPFQNQELIAKCALPVAARCLELFARHVCIIRPLGEGGRQKISADFNQIEVAVSPLCRPLSDVGKTYRLIRSLKPMFSMTCEEIAVSPSLGHVVPYSLALLSLFAHGPPELSSPHQNANWSVSRFSQWLDAHPSEREQLELIGGALQRYQQKVRQKGQAQFHAVYPAMLTLLETGLKFASQTPN